eukprot:TRINITY_DN82_c0_g2_i1.p1 TRINITY_DN82_c0_g2~~TRINITY_DN82_c0_g2_i1.p1  ORF type:complete len:184 (+),score=23.70 TRINITY_DN82_c0_g2_i1:192-743(+)
MAAFAISMNAGVSTASASGQQRHLEICCSNSSSSTDQQVGVSERAVGEHNRHPSQSGHSSMHQDSKAVLSLIGSSVDRNEDRWYGGLFNLPAEDWAGILPGSPQEMEKSPVLTGAPNSRRNVRRQSITSRSGHHEAMPLHRFKPVQFSAEKAKLLRQEMRKNKAWHDTMYHSGTASRLASAVS